MRTRATLLSIAILSAACGSSTQTNVTAPTTTRCQATVSNSTASFAAAGGTGTINVTVSRECSWTASSQASWIALTSAREGQGEATIAYRVSENGDPVTRRGTIAVNDTQIEVGQEAGPCRYQLSQLSQEIAHAGGDATIDLRTHPVCTWTAASDDQWVTISPPSGRGDATLRVTVAPNTGEARATSVTVAGERIRVTQAASGAVTVPAPPPSPTPPPTIPPPPEPPPPAPTPPPPTPPPPPVPPPPEPPPPPPAPQPTPIELRGRIDSVTGSCPVVTFVLQGRTVYTSATTTFKGGSCKDVKRNKVVTVTGLVRNDGRVEATEIRIRDDDDDDQS